MTKESPQLTAEMLIKAMEYLKNYKIKPTMWITNDMRLNRLKEELDSKSLPRNKCWQNRMKNEPR